MNPHFWICRKQARSMAISALFILAIFSYFFILGHCLHTHSTNEPYRTAFHFQPPQNWINDPTGPMRYMGLYHLFYQYNPKGAAWGNIVWGHSVSKDLIDWIIMESAISPSEPFDIGGTWSGSATILSGGRPAILYTGLDKYERELQNLAFPKNASDPFLKEWIKIPQNPVMAPTRANKINSSSFRDPTTAWLGKDGHYRVLVGNKRDTTGRALLYRSKDFVRWVQAKHPLYFANGTGMWECPDFFPVLHKSVFGVETSIIDGPFVKHVLKVSLDDTKQDYYLIGTYDAKKDKFVPDSIEGFHNIASVLRYDYGKYYASKTFFDDSTKRRILLGWANESSSKAAAYLQRGWSGIHSVPRAIWLHQSGNQLVQWPVVEVEKLRAQPISWPTRVLKAGHHIQVTGVTAAQVDVEVSFETNELGEAEVLEQWVKPQLLCSRKGASVKGGLGPFGLLAFASKDLKEYTAIFFRVFIYQRKPLVLFCSDQSRSSLNHVDNDLTTYGTFLDIDPSYENLSLRSLIDHSVVESFGGEGRAVITARVYPTLAINDEANLFIFNHGTDDIKISQLSACSMKKAQIHGSTS